MQAMEAVDDLDLVRPSSLPIPSFVSQELSAKLDRPHIDVAGDENIVSDDSSSEQFYVETGEVALSQEPWIQSTMVPAQSEKSFTSTQCPESDKGSASGADDEAVCADALGMMLPMYVPTGDAGSLSKYETPQEIVHMDFQNDDMTWGWAQGNTGPWMQTPMGKNPSNWQVLNKTRLCKFFARGGQCAKGRACTFAHRQAELRPSVDFTRTCFCPAKLQRGVCNNPKCRYAHTQKELRIVEMPKTKLCSFYHGKGCMLGKACRFAHGVDMLSTKRF